MGERIARPELAAVLRAIGREGKDAFYKGRVAEAIIEEARKHGSLLTLEDLAAHGTTFPEALSTTFRGVRLHEVPPQGQGITALIALNLLQHLEAAGKVDLSPRAQGSIELLHTLIEVMRIAFADTRWHVADPTMEPAAHPARHGTRMPAR